MMPSLLIHHPCRQQLRHSIVHLSMRAVLRHAHDQDNRSSQAHMGCTLQADWGSGVSMKHLEVHRNPEVVNHQSVTAMGNVVRL